MFCRSPRICIVPSIDYGSRVVSELELCSRESHHSVSVARRSLRRHGPARQQRPSRCIACGLVSGVASAAETTLIAAISVGTARLGGGLAGRRLQIYGRSGRQSLLLGGLVLAAKVRLLHPAPQSRFRDTGGPGGVGNRGRSEQSGNGLRITPFVCSRHETSLSSARQRHHCSV